jgi:hypothetical protein
MLPRTVFVFCFYICLKAHACVSIYARMRTCVFSQQRLSDKAKCKLVFRAVHALLWDPQCAQLSPDRCDCTLMPPSISLITLCTHHAPAMDHRFLGVARSIRGLLGGGLWLYGAGVANSLHFYFPNQAKDRGFLRRTTSIVIRTYVFLFIYFFLFFINPIVFTICTCTFSK